jgi:hypothetical protein
MLKSNLLPCQGTTNQSKCQNTAFYLLYKSEFECEAVTLTGKGNTEIYFEIFIKSHQTNWSESISGESMPWFLSFQPKKFQAWFCWKEEGFLAQCSSFKLVYKKKFILIEFANFKKNSFWLDAIQVLSNWFMKINLFWSNSPISCCTFFIQAKQIELEVLEYSKYIIGTFSSSTANQRAAQKNCYIEWDFGDPSICTN